jgi:hypothetical protein
MTAHIITSTKDVGVKALEASPVSVARRLSKGMYKSAMTYSNGTYLAIHETSGRLVPDFKAAQRDLDV